MKFLLRFYRPHAWSVITALVIMIPGSAISLIFPRLTGNLVDTIIKDGSGNTLTNLAGIFLGLLLVQGVIGYFVSITLAKTTENVIASLRADLFEHIVRLPLSYLSERRIGELASRLSSDLTQVQETFTFTFIQLFRQGIFLVGSLIIIVTTSLPLTVPIVIGTPIVVGIAVIIGRRIRKLSTATQDALAASATIVEETLHGITAVKAYVMEGHETSRYKDALSKNVHLAVKGAKVRAFFVTFIVFVVFGGIAGVIIYGANLVANHAITIGELLSFLMYAMFVGGALGSFAELIGQVQKTAGASVRLQELMEAPCEATHSSKDIPLETIQQFSNRVSAANDAAAPALEFKNVHFSYQDRENASVLSAVSFSIESGSRVAFVGESGAGKSTTAALVQRLYEPTSGELFYHGIAATHLTLEQVRSHVGIVPQDIVLFGGSIEENIRYGKPDANSDEIAAAVESANVLEFVNRFPDGLHTVVGERGVKLSGGQRQRVAIARALLKNPPLLILDEATSSLDAETEHLIQEALERLMSNRTTIIIAHRLSTVRKCDNIMVFEQGRIIESGTHSNLMKIADGRYRRWCDLQFIT